MGPGGCFVCAGGLALLFCAFINQRSFSINQSSDLKSGYNKDLKKQIKLNYNDNH